MKHAPKHRGTPPTHALVVAPRKALRNTLLLSSVAVTVTGVTVGGGLVSSPSSVGAAAAAASSGQLGQDAAAAPDPARLQAAAATLDRSDDVTLSRSADRRDDADPRKEAALSADSGPAVSGAENLADSAPTDIAKALIGNYGWDESQFGCLYDLWQRESGWNPHAENVSSGAYGIPQSLPGSKMASVAPDWQTNPVTQITWGLEYIQERYGSPCGAWGHSQATGFY